MTKWIAMYDARDNRVSSRRVADRSVDRVWRTWMRLRCRGDYLVLLDHDQPASAGPPDLGDILRDSRDK